MTIKKRTFFLCFILTLGVLWVASALSQAAVSPARADDDHNLIINGDFSNDESWPWVTSETWPVTVTGVVENGEFCVTVNNLDQAKNYKGSLQPYDAQMRQRRLKIVTGHTYTASFFAYVKPDDPEHPENIPAGVTIHPQVADGHPTYHNYVNKGNGSNESLTFSLNGSRPAEPYSFTFTIKEKTGDLSAEFGFHLGYKENEDVTICFDDIKLEDPEYTPTVEAPYEPKLVRVNQVGYFVSGPKLASMVMWYDAPLPWKLQGRNNEGEIITLAEGETVPLPIDITSIDYVHTIDFTGYTTKGTNLWLDVNGNTSHPFDIRDDLYSQMKLDALSYFYQNRSGIAIEADYVGDLYARGAGPKERDTQVPCFTGWGMDYTDETKTEHTTWENCNGLGLNYIYPEDYTISAPKGWFDAGDHGKYVVNGGISVWTLLNLYERSQYWGDGRYASADPNIFQMKIPEQGGNVPDILDEARWEIEFMRSMRIKDYRPGGDPMLNPAGLVHHMLHDDAWTDMPNRVDDLEKNNVGYNRTVYPPSLAATFNFVAVAAQAARIWEGIDKKYAATLYKEAEGSFLKAYNICSDAHSDTQKYINICAKPFNKEEQAYKEWYAKYGGLLAGYNRFNGGGPYDDDDLSDEFYWAAAELYATTGSPVFLEILLDSPHKFSVPVKLATGDSAPMTWQDTAALGTISLAITEYEVKEGKEMIRTVAPEVAKQARANIIAAADAYLANIQAEDNGYGTPYAHGSEGYAWGSNSFVLNELIVMGLAYDLNSGGDQYLYGMVSGMDYILGRNAMDKSYVSGYGENPLLNPHHRHWGYQGWVTEDMRYPRPPAGAVSGGPYSGPELDVNKATIAMNLRAECQYTPQKCYVDDIDAYAVNEITINWNAPFAWVTAYLDEKFNPTAAYQVVQGNWIFLPFIQLAGNR